MNRRQFITGIGVAAAGGTTAVGSGAFDSVEADREVTVNVEGDKTAYLKFVERDPFSEYQDTSDQLKISDLNSLAGEGGVGVGPDSEYYFDDVFGIVNQGSEPIYFWIDDSVEDDFEMVDDFYFYPGDPDESNGDREERLEGSGESVLELGAGDSAIIGLFIDTDTDPDGNILPETPGSDDDARVFADVDDQGATVIENPNEIPNKE